MSANLQMGWMNRVIVITQGAFTKDEDKLKRYVNKCDAVLRCSWDSSPQGTLEIYEP